MDKTVVDAFEAKYIPEPNSGCWLWTGNRFSASRGGYGCFTCRPHGIINARAHRVAFEIYCHPIASTEHVLHRCDNVLCVNPEHLFLGDQRSNMADKVSKRRQDRGSRHGMAKLSEEQARDIKHSPTRGRDIAMMYGVSEATVSEIRSGKHWSHL